MTVIFSVDTSFSQSSHQDGARQRAEDFAKELNHPGKQGGADAHGDIPARKEADFGSQELGGADASKPIFSGEISPGLLSIQDKDIRGLELAAPVDVVPTNATQELLHARVYGWHAMAQAYLSELTLADTHSKEHASPFDGGGWDAEAGEVVAYLEPPAETSAPSITGKTFATIPTNTGAQSASDAMEGDPDLFGVAEVTPADIAATTYWPEQSLRFSRLRNGSCVAWLRDFRLTEAEADQLIRFVVDDAQKNGFALSKVMLNGREAWASPDHI